MIANTYKTQLESIQSYIDSVLDGSVNVGELERMAVQRHVYDLEHAAERGFYFDEEIAKRAVLFFPHVLRHFAAEWHNQPFELCPWQAFVIWVCFGWREADTKLRRFRKLYISVGRKNGKSTLIAGIAIYVQYADEPPENAGEVYCTATTLEQAQIIFDMCERLIRMSPSLSRRSKIFSRSIHNTEYDSYMRPVSPRKGRHGSNPSLVIFDELHEYGEYHRPAYEALTTGSASRRQALQVTITTAGDPGGSSPIWEEEEAFAESVIRTGCSPEPVADTVFALICRVDKEDDPLDPKNFRKANPNLGISVKERYLREQAIEAKHIPSARSKFLRFHANYPTGSAEKAFTMEAWEACTREAQQTDQEPCYAGLDMGLVYDFTGFSLLFPRDDGTYWLESWMWTASQNPHVKVDQEPYRTWVQEDQLRIHPGTALDVDVVKADIVSILKDVNCLGLAFDPHSAKLMAQQLNLATDVILEEFPQNPSHYNEPLQQFIYRINEQRIHHDGNRCLAWQADNLIIKRSAQDKWMPDKGHGTRKIDGLVAATMALSLAMFAEKQDTYYETNPVTMI